MRILVPVKRVVDYNVKVRVKATDRALNSPTSRCAMNPFDEIAVEEALRLKESGKATEVVAVSIGPAQASETHPHRPRHGRRSRHPGEGRGYRRAARGRQDPKAIAEEEQPGLVILGKQAIDDDSNQTGQMLAALLGWSQATFASKLEVEGSDSRSPAKSTAARRPSS